MSTTTNSTAKTIKRIVTVAPKKINIFVSDVGSYINNLASEYNQNGKNLKLKVERMIAFTMKTQHGIPSFSHLTVNIQELNDSSWPTDGRGHKIKATRALEPLEIDGEELKMIAPKV